jgi:hypothetical protein
VFGDDPSCRDERKQGWLPEAILIKDALAWADS